MALQDLSELQRRVEEGELATVVAELAPRTPELDRDSARMLLYWQRHLGDFAGARETAGGLLEEDPGDRFVVQTLADIAWIEGDYAGAERQLRVLEGLARDRGDRSAESDAAAQRSALENHVEATVLEARRAEPTLDALFWAAVLLTVLGSLAAGFLGALRSR